MPARGSHSGASTEPRVALRTRGGRKYKRNHDPLLCFFSPHTNNNKQQEPASTATIAQTTTTAMSFFKSSKNQSASAASTPAQTPRSSMDVSRTGAQKVKMTREQALQMAMDKSLGPNASAMLRGNIRI